MIDDTTGYISFSEFSQTIAEQIHYALDLLAERGMTSCILDLRDNYGGLLDEAAKIADIFVGGHTRLFWMRSLHEQFEDTIYATEATPYESLPLTVLVNHNTWSAAEILAGCLQDLDRATIVGEATGGKALVMRHFRLSNGGRVLMTIAGAIMPSGRCTQSLFHNGNYDFGPPDIPNGVNDHSHDEIYTQMPCHRFRTLHGREVSWHEGIIPDIVIAETEEYPDRWYIDAIDTFAVGILRDSSDAYRKMSLAAFMGAPRVAPAIVEKIEKRLVWLDTSAHRSVTTHFAPQLARTVDWRLAARIWDVDASLRYFTCKLPIVRRAWQEPRPQTFTAPAH
jgi:C-terminal processing protease CtpA/Prc